MAIRSWKTTMNPENLYEKYQQLLEENQLLRNRIASLEATIKNTGVSLVEDGATKYLDQTCHHSDPSTRKVEFRFSAIATFYQ